MPRGRAGTAPLGLGYHGEAKRPCHPGRSCDGESPAWGALLPRASLSFLRFTDQFHPQKKEWPPRPGGPVEKEEGENGRDDPAR